MEWRRVVRHQVDPDDRAARDLERLREVRREDAYSAHVREAESYGALCFHNGGTPGDDDDGGSSEWVADEWAGFLARCIATHDQTHGGEE